MDAEAAQPLCEGRYRLLSVLGHGGTATVYRAYDANLEVERAVKILSPKSAGGSMRKRFLQEAKTLARLRHPNVLTVHDVGIDANRPYMVMELIRDGSLQDRLDSKGPLSAPEAVAVCQAVLSALAFTHGEGVVHRDIKPGNILLDEDGTIKVADFGLAQVTQQEGHSLTRTGTSMGTYAYMAPEQRLDASRVDHRADLYAVGATLVVLITRREPFDLYVEEAAREALAELPPALADVIRHCCRFDPSERYSSAEELSNALAQAMVGAATGPQPLRGVRPLDVIPGSQTPSRARLAVLGGLLSLAVGAWLGGSFKADPPGPAPAVRTGAEPDPMTAQEPPVEAVPEPAPPTPPTPEPETVPEPEPSPILTEKTRTPPKAQPTPVATPPPEPAPTPAQAPSGQGALRVGSVPFGSVSIDGRKTGVTPWFGDVSAGSHRITVQLSDGRSHLWKRTVRAGSQGNLCWDFMLDAECPP